MQLSRIAKIVIQQVIEPKWEPIFDSDSFGYRPGCSAHQAVELCRRRCWERDWVLDLDINGFSIRSITGWRQSQRQPGLAVGHGGPW